MANENPNITLDGDISPLRQKLREASEQLKKVGTDGEQAFGRMTGPLKVLQDRFVAIGALLAGGAVFKESVDQAARLTEESTKLARAMGTSASEASILREALTAGNTSQEEFVGAAKGLSKQLKENEDGLQAMGLKTRDATGQLRPLTELTLDAIGVLNGYRAGTDRAIAGQVMFGKGFEMTSNLALMNKKSVADVAEQMRALGVVVSQENVAAWQAYDAAGDQASLTMQALKTTVGNAVMPVLTKLAEWFSAIGPAAVVVIRGALGGLISLFWGLKTAAGIAFELINASVIQLTEPIRAVSVAFWKLIHGDFEGAKAELANIPKVWNDGWKTSFDNIVKDATEARDKMWNLFADGTPAGGEGKGGKSATGLLKGDKDKKAKTAEDPSFMGVYEARLAEIKNAYEQENVLRQFNKEQELAYWRELQQNYQLTSKDRLAIAKRTATLELDIRRASAKDQRDLDTLGIDSRRASSEAQIKIEEQQANFSRENGIITQRELIALEEEFARRRFEIEYQALLERLELAKSDPNASPVELARIKEQMLEVERNYILRRGEIHQQAAVESGAIWHSLTDTISGLWDKGIQALLNGTLTWRNAFRAIGAEMVSWFAVEVVGKKVKGWVMGEAAQTSATVAGTKVRTLAETLAAKNSVVLWAATAVKNIMTSAWEAMAAAWKAMVGIPIIGPALGVIAAGVAFKGVSALAKNVSSAERGYDIPAGVNPMTQLHEKEMVLPKEHANVIRSLAGLSTFGFKAPMMNRYTLPQGLTQFSRIREEEMVPPQRLANVIRGLASGGGDGQAAGAAEAPVVINLSTMDVKGVKDWLKSNSSALGPALRRAARNHAPTTITSPLGKIY